MALAALIAACREADDDTDSPAALLPLAGRSLLEHQARRAARAGATRILVVVEKLPTALTASIDRLRADGLAVEVARSATDAADRIHPAERLLVFAEGLFVDQGLADRMAAASPPAILIAADGPERREWERIDAHARWAGLAMIDGACLRRTAAMLGEWDIISTLLRQAVGEGAERIDLFDGAAAGAPPLHAFIETQGDAEQLSQQVLAGSGHVDRDWPAALFRPFERPIVAALMRRHVEADWLRVGGAALAAAAALLFGLAWLRSGLLLMLLSGPVEAVGARLGAVRLQASRHEGRIAAARIVASGAALLILGARLSRDGRGHDPMFCAAAIVVSLFALTRETTLLSRHVPGRLAPRWIASPDAVAWGLLPFAIAGAWRIGLAAMAAYAAVSFLQVQRLLLGALRGGEA